MQAKEIFLQAIEIDDADQREALVEEKCGEDEALKRKVHALLAANEDPESFLDQSAARFDVTATAFGNSNSSSLSDSSDHGRFLPGTKLADRYRIVSMLGRGGMGEVYRADDLRLGQTVALKFLPRELANHAKRLEYFHQEVKLARQISHPNICRVYDIGEVNGQPFLSMEYIDGEDLKTLLQRIGRLPKDKGIQIARQLCSGLAAAHAKGVLHRDLKPANIMVDGQGQVRITDFGLATVSTDGENVIGMSGTPGYMAPEQLLSGQTNVRTDIYSLGLILFEVFTGKPAHDASSIAELKNLHADSSCALNASDLVEDMDPAVERAISRCLSSDASMRPRSVSELAASLPGGDPLAAALAAGETPHPEIVAMSGDSNPLPLPKGLLLVGLLAAGLAISLFGIGKVERINKIEPFLSPEVLKYRAQNTLEQLGYESLSEAGDFAFGFDEAETQKNNNEIAKRSGFEKWPTMGFWYRETPTEFQSDTMGFAIAREGAASVDAWYPAWTQAEMQGVRLDVEGRLRWFQANPPLRMSEPASKTMLDWESLFSEDLVGFRLADLESATPEVVPPVVYDQYQAWEGTWPSTDDPLYVVAASFREKPVYFEILPEPGERTLETTNASLNNAGRVIQLTAIWLMIFVAGVLVVRNVYLRRWDRRGVVRLVQISFAFWLISILINAHHVPSTWEFAVWINCISNSLWASSLVALHYAALEPAVRRHWPELLISWSRVMGGRLTDPMVGSDILTGVLAATGMCVLATTLDLFEGQGIGFYSPQTLLGVMPSIGNLIGGLISSSLFILEAAFALVIVKIVLRKKSFALGFGVLFYGLVFCLLRESEAYLLPLTLAQVGLVVFVFARHGVLGAIATMSCSFLFANIFTIDPARPYFAGSMVYLTVLLALTVFAFVTAIGGWRRLFQPQSSLSGSAIQ